MKKRTRSADDDRSSSALYCFIYTRSLPVVVCRPAFPPFISIFSSSSFCHSRTLAPCSSLGTPCVKSEDDARAPPSYTIKRSTRELGAQPVTTFCPKN